MKSKRQLTLQEVEEIRDILEAAPQGRKPSIGWFANRYRVNKPSIIKSLGGWVGIQRNRPQPPKKSIFDAQVSASELVKGV